MVDRQTARKAKINNMGADVLDLQSHLVGIYREGDRDHGGQGTPLDL